MKRAIFCRAACFPSTVAIGARPELPSRSFLSGENGRSNQTGRQEIQPVSRPTPFKHCYRPLIGDRQEMRDLDQLFGVPLEAGKPFTQLHFL